MRYLPLLMALASCSLFKPPESALVGQLDREVLALKEVNARLQAQANSCDELGGSDPLYAELHQVFTSTEVEVSREGRATVVKIPGEQLFAPGSVRIRQEAQMVLDLVATGLASHPERAVMVMGHTDDQAITGTLRSSYASNWELSAARSSAFVRELVEDFQLDPARFTIGGRSHYDPIRDNSTPEGRASNRRIVLHIFPEEIE